MDDAAWDPRPARGAGPALAQSNSEWVGARRLWPRMTWSGSASWWASLDTCGTCGIHFPVLTTPPSRLRRSRRLPLPDKPSIAVLPLPI